MLNRQINQHIIEKRQIAESVLNMRSVWKVMKLVLTFGLVLTLLVGCGDPNLGDPKVREKIWAEAIDEDSLQNRRGPSGEELRYAPNQERPYDGWVRKGWLKSSGELYQFQKRHGISIIGGLYQVQNGKRHGTHIHWYSNQQNYERGFFRDGEENGMWTRWYENGQKRTEGSYKDGEGNGTLTEWYENGQKRTEGSYKEGWKEGMWTEWNENGQKKSEGSYKEGWKEGMWTEWSMNGQIHGKGFYKKGQIEDGGALTPQIHGGKQVDSGGEGALTPIQQETTSESVD